MAVFRQGVVHRASDVAVRVVIHEASSTGEGDFGCRVEFDPAIYPPSSIVGIDESQARDLATSYVEKLFEGESVVFSDEENE